MAVDEQIAEGTTPAETAADKAEAKAEFASGYVDDAPEPTATPAEGTATETMTKTEDAPASVPEPRFVQVTEDDLKRFNTTAAAIDEIKATVEKQFGTAFGKMGGLERTLKQMQEATPSGQALVVSESDFEEMKADFPELAEMQVKGLNRALAKLKGTGGGTASAFNPEQVTKIVNEAVVATEQKIAKERLADRHEDWEDVINGPARPDGRNGLGTDGKPTAYRQWLATKPETYQRQVLDTWNPRLVASSLDEFKKIKAAPAKTARPSSSRADLLAEAETPRGTPGGAGRTTTDANEKFREGYAEG